MFETEKGLEEKIKKLEGEVKLFKQNMKGKDRGFWKLKAEGAMNQLDKARARLIIVKAKNALKAKKKK